MIWFIILISGLVTYAMRLVFLTPAMPQNIPDWADKAMKLVPVSVLSTIIIAEIFIIDGTVPPIEENPRFIAALIALIIAYHTKSVLATIGSGLGILWLLQYFLA